jgi:hypothetical protein
MQQVLFVMVVEGRIALTLVLSYLLLLRSQVVVIAMLERYRSPLAEAMELRQPSA